MGSLTTAPREVEDSNLAAGSIKLNSETKRLSVYYQTWKSGGEPRLVLSF